MKRFLSLALFLCFSLNSFAATGTVQELSRAMDEFEYSMNVEWDQKDKNFQLKEMNKFLARTQELLDGGLSKEEIQAHMSKRTKRTKASEALELKMKLSNVTTAKELVDFMSQNSKGMYSQGASWNGGVDLTTVGLIAGTVLLIAVLLYSQKRCLRYESVYSCKAVYVSCGTSEESESCYDGDLCKYYPECQEKEK